MRLLRNNTATRVTVGPFLDVTDGVTPETSLTVTNCKLTMVIDDAGVPTLALDVNATASGGSNDMVHVSGDDAGFYDLELTAAQLNRLGRAVLAITDASNHRPVVHEFMVVPASIYDAYTFGALQTAYPQAKSGRFAGFEQVTGLSAVKSLTVPDGARGAFLQAITQDVMFRADGTNPTASVGILLTASASPLLLAGSSTAEGQDLLDALKFIEVTPSAVLNVQYVY